MAPLLQEQARSRLARIFISTFPFGREDIRPIELLQKSGQDFAINSLNRKLQAEELARLAADADCLVAGTEDLLPLIQSSSRLRHIARVGIGLDSVPLALCREKGIRVSYTPHAVTPAVAELSIGLMLDATRRITFSDRELRTGGWTRPYGRRLGDSIVGIIGMGKIGGEVARLVASFGPREILIYDKRDCTDRISKIAESGASVRQTSIDDILSQGDVVTLHVPLTRQTRRMIAADSLKKMKKTAFLINTSRGGVVDEGDLAVALRESWIAGAAIDVFDREPYHGEFTQLENIVLTQHIASCAYDCRARMEIEAVQDTLRFLEGEALINEVPEEEYGYQLE